MPTVKAFTIGARIKRDLRAHLRELGFTKKPDGSLNPPNGDKNTYRHLHRRHRDAKSEAAERLVIERLGEFERYFASGADIDPAKVEPVLEEIDSDGWQTKLFRAASLTWSVPVSNGYGRRMRFLVWDKQNSKLIGLIALGDPVFNMGARDRIIGWNSADILSYLKKRRRSYADGHQFGDGPNWRMRAVRLALKLLEVNEEVLRHNLQREIFMCKFASNAYAYMCGHAKRVRYDDLLPVSEVSALARARWIVPRALRRPEFANWTRDETLHLIRRDAAPNLNEVGLLLEA